MSEVERIARLLEQTFQGKPYYGPSVLDTLAGVTAKIAIQKPQWSAHSIWELVNHLTAELNYAREVIEGTATPYAENNTWPEITTASNSRWQQALQELKRANRALIRAVKKLDDKMLQAKPSHVRGPFYLMLHGTLQHTVYHAGQISLLAGHRVRRKTHE